MADRPETLLPSTPEASAAAAQDRRQGARGTTPRAGPRETLAYRIGQGSHGRPVFDCISGGNRIHSIARSKYSHWIRPPRRRKAQSP